MKLIKNQGRISSNGGKTPRFVKMYLRYSNKFTLRGEREKERERRKKFVGGNIISTNEVNGTQSFKVINVSSN